LFRNFSPDVYPKYDNYDAVEVSKTADIPCDYYGIMGVPITFADKYNPDQFEFLGIDKDYTSDGNRFKLTENGKQRTLYARMVIRRKQYKSETRLSARYKRISRSMLCIGYRALTVIL